MKMTFIILFTLSILFNIYVRVANNHLADRILQQMKYETSLSHDLQKEHEANHELVKENKTNREIIKKLANK
jgi:hypothetical protein